MRRVLRWLWPDLGHVESLPRPGETGEQADARAMASDWRAVGDDLRAASLELAEGGVEDAMRTIRLHADAIAHARDSAEVLRLTAEMRETVRRLERLSRNIDAARREIRRS